MRSDDVKSGYQRAPNRSLLRSLGVTDREMDLPFVGIANAYNTIMKVSPLAEGFRSSSG
jgi:dihydroxy-acid dehydratase